jgi:iron complex transport system permease protein
VPVARSLVVLFAVCALITGTLVALAGAIGFVGLMVPHIARRLVGGRHQVMLPVAALIGAMLLVVVDILARTALSPQELPLGIITGAVGGLFFIWLMRRGSRL